MRSRRASNGSARPLNCGVMWPDPKESSRVRSRAFALCRKRLRSRGAAAAEAFLLLAGGERRCIVRGPSVTGFGSFGRVFVSAARTPIAHTVNGVESLIWHDYIGDPTLADAILDRIVHRSHRIHLQAKESMRKRAAGKEAAKAQAEA